MSATPETQVPETSIFTFRSAGSPMKSARGKASRSIPIRYSDMDNRFQIDEGTLVASSIDMYRTRTLAYERWEMSQGSRALILGGVVVALLLLIGCEPND